MSHMIIKPRNALLLAALIAVGVQAKVSEEEAARLGKDLAPLGGEIAGNEDGTIPAWAPYCRACPRACSTAALARNAPIPTPMKKPWSR